MELSRGFKALKIWMSLKENGIEKYKNMIEQNIAQARYLAELVRNQDELELMADVQLSIVCYRFNFGEHSTEELNVINKELLMRLQERGVAAPSYTMLGGNYVIRACITNHRTKKSDLELLVKKSVEIGREILLGNGS